jgi:hypothetical protein
LQYLLDAAEGAPFETPRGGSRPGTGDFLTHACDRSEFSLNILSKDKLVSTSFSCCSGTSGNPNEEVAGPSIEAPAPVTALSSKKSPF